MYPKGTRIYDELGELYATLAVAVAEGDYVFPEQFEFHQTHLLPPEAGEPIPDPICKFVEGEPYKPKD